MDKESERDDDFEEIPERLRRGDNAYLLGKILQDEVGWQRASMDHLAVVYGLDVLKTTSIFPLGLLRM